MANAIIGFPVYSDTSTLYTPTLSGGSFVATLPLGNLTDRRQHYVARSSTAAVADTQFTVDLGVARAVRCIGLVGHNISSVAPSAGTEPQVRVRGFSSPPILDAGGYGYAPFALGWTAVGTPTRTANATLATNGVYLDLIGDDSGAVEEGYYRGVTFTGNGTKTVTCVVKAGTATVTHMGINDGTTGAWRHLLYLTWTAGVPVATTQVGGGSVTITALGGGVYRIVITATGVVAVNTNNVYCYAASITAADTGTTYYGDIQAYDAATDPLVYDSGVTAALPSGADAEERDGWNPTYIHLTPSDMTARYWRVNINDDNNPDTYVEIGRLAITGGIQPAVNASVGMTLGWTDPDTTKQRTDGAATVYNARRRRREVRMVFEQLSDADAFGPMAQLLQRAGTSGQMLFALDPDDAATIAWQRQFLGVLTELSPIQFPYPTYRGLPIAITEEL